MAVFWVVGKDVYEAVKKVYYAVALKVVKTEFD